jgi:ABC-type phosphate transport system auxiliary subunit
VLGAAVVGGAAPAGVGVRWGVGVPMMQAASVSIPAITLMATIGFIFISLTASTLFYFWLCPGLSGAVRISSAGGDTEYTR